MNKRWSKENKRFPSQRTPNFDSGVLAEPLLAFGGGHRHVDPKVGLGLYGPYTLAGQDRPPLSNIIVGMVGTNTTIANTEQWIRACEGILTNDGSQPFLYPHFPGFNSDHPFRCQLTYGDTWRECIKSEDITKAINIPNFFNRIKNTVSLYLNGVETLSQRDPKPNVILCCIPQEVIDFCTVRKTKYGVEKRIKRTKSELTYQRIADTGQGFFFPDMNPGLGIEDEESGHENLRRGLKAETMQFGIPTQLVWPRTTQIVNNDSLSEASVQDRATRAWNFMTALYHKAGGTPWRLAEVEPGTCFVGISFYREKVQEYPHMRTSMAQTFTASGDGYVIRGDSFEWEESRLGNSPHLDNKSAAALIREVISLYQRQNRGAMPGRLVLHKSSRFWNEELSGFKNACEPIPRKDFVAWENGMYNFIGLATIRPFAVLS